MIWFAIYPLPDSFDLDRWCILGRLQDRVSEFLIELGAPGGEARDEDRRRSVSRARSGRFIGPVTLRSVVSGSNGFWIVEFVQRPFPLTRGGFDALWSILIVSADLVCGMCSSALLLQIDDR